MTVMLVVWSNDGLLGLAIKIKLTIGAGKITTFCVALAEFPEWSVAVQTTCVVPTGKLAGTLLVIVGLYFGIMNF